MTFFTTGRIHGLALLSLYAPIPKSTFLSKVSALYAAISPKRGSSGACGTASAEKLVGCGCAMWPVILCSRKEGDVDVAGAEEDEGEGERENENEP